jgi:hypothetical protein
MNGGAVGNIYLMRAQLGLRRAERCGSRPKQRE